MLNLFLPQWFWSFYFLFLECSFSDLSITTFLFSFYSHVSVHVPSPQRSIPWLFYSILFSSPITVDRVILIFFYGTYHYLNLPHLPIQLLFNILECKLHEDKNLVLSGLFPIITLLLIITVLGTWQKLNIHWMSKWMKERGKTPGIHFR